MMDALLRDDRLRWDLARLASNMDQLMPDGLGEGYDVQRRAAARPRAGARADRPAPGAGPARGRSSGRSSRRGPRRPRPRRGPRAARAGQPPATSRRSTSSPASSRRPATSRAKGDRLELTPRGSRRIGQKVLDDLFARLSRDAFGGHRIDRSGRGGEREETTKPYEFGDPFHLDIRGTIENALRRPENSPDERLARGEPGVHLSPADFEVFRTEQLTKTSTVLLVDMSRSMLLRGCFVAAKKVAVALDTLIRTQFPHDDLVGRRLRLLRPRAAAGGARRADAGTATSTARTSSTG